MSICLLIINKISKVKVAIRLKCAPFFDVLHMSQGEILLQPPQQIP